MVAAMPANRCPTHWRDHIWSKRPRSALARTRSERGQVMVLITIALVVMMGFAALASDIGLMWRVKLQMQGAADAAAVAGAAALLAGGSGAPSSAAQALSSSNGFTNGSSTSSNSHLVSVTV